MKTSDVKIETVPREDGWADDVPADCIRNGSPSILIAARSSGNPAYLRRLRAAEMAAWKFSGGDYLLSEWASRSVRHGSRTEGSRGQF